MAQEYYITQFNGINIYTQPDYTFNSVCIPESLLKYIEDLQKACGEYKTPKNIFGIKRETTAKYRKKPVIIEAYQTDHEFYIKTLEGVMKASIGDYIITGIDGEQYPCKPDIFEKTYELVEE